MTKINQNKNTILGVKEGEIRYEDKHGHYTILAVYEGEYVRFSREEGKELGEEEVMHFEDFEQMIREEEWRLL